MAINKIADRLVAAELGTSRPQNGAFINWVHGKMIREKAYQNEKGEQKTLLSVSIDVTDDLIKDREPGTLVSLTLTPGFVKVFDSSFKGGEISDTYKNILLAKNPNTPVKVSYAIAGSGVTDENGKVTYSYNTVPCKAGAIAASYAQAKADWYAANKQD